MGAAAEGATFKINGKHLRSPMEILQGPNTRYATTLSNSKSDFFRVIYRIPKELL